MRCRRFQHIAQGRDEGVDAATEILQINQQHIEGIHHGVCRAAHIPVETKYGNTQHRIDEIRGFHHIVLLVAAQAVLWTKRSAECNVRQTGQGIQRMC